MGLILQIYVNAFPHGRNTMTQRHSHGYRKWLADSFHFEKFSATFGHFPPAALHTGMKVFRFQTKIPPFEDRFCCF